MRRRRALAALAGLVSLSVIVSPAIGQDAAAEPLVGSWRFDPAALDKLALAIGGAMAKDLKPAQRRSAALKVKEMEASYAALAKSDPAKAKAMENDLRAARATASALERDPERFFGSSFLARLGDPARSTLTLNPAGEVTFEGMRDGQPAQGGGAWKREGDQVIVATTLPGAAVDSDEFLVLRGKLEGDRLVMTYEIAPEDEAELRDKPALRKAMSEVRWVLVRV